jgi:hypothetical protein
MAGTSTFPRADPGCLFPCQPENAHSHGQFPGGFGTTMPFTIHPSAGSRYHIEKKGHFWLAAEMNG